jgi:hypothetical protein
MKRYFIGLSLLCALMLILLVGYKLDEQAIAVIIGMGLGILASIPTSLVVAFVLLQKERQVNKEAGQNKSAFTQQPPVVVVTGGNQPSSSPPQTYPFSYPVTPPGNRTFTIVGEESTELEVTPLP